MSEISKDSKLRKEEYEENIVFYKVEKILDQKVVNEKTYYLIKWLEWPESFNSWEDINTLNSVKELISEFLEKKGISKNHSKRENMEKEKSGRNLKKLQKNNPLYGHFKYGDKPISVISIENANKNKKDRVELLCTVNWEKRASGEIPLNSVFSNFYLKKRAPIILINFFETKIKVIKEKYNSKNN